MPRYADPVVSDAILGVVVGPYFLGAGAMSYCTASLGINFGQAFFFLAFPELRAEQVEGDLAVTLLIALLSTYDCDPTGLVN